MVELSSTEKGSGDGGGEGSVCITEPAGEGNDCINSSISSLTPESKRRDTKTTPVRLEAASASAAALASASAAAGDGVTADGQALLPSQVIASAVESGEIKAKHTYQGGTSTSTSTSTSTAGTGGGGNNLVQGGAFGGTPATMNMNMNMPPPVPTPQQEEEENTDDDSDNNYSSEDDDEEENQESDGEEAEQKDDREPGFANVDKTLAGPDQILTGSTRTGAKSLHFLGAALFKVTEEKIKVMHLRPEDIPKEAPSKGWQ